MGYEKLSRAKIEDRIEQALLLLEKCRVCPRRCGVNRLENRVAICRSGRKAANINRQVCYTVKWIDKPEEL